MDLVEKNQKDKNIRRRASGLGLFLPTLTCFLAILLSLPFSAQSQSNPLDAINPNKTDTSPLFLPPNLISQAAAALSLPQNDPRVQALFNPSARKRYNNKRERTQKYYPADQSRIAAHYRSKKGGEPVITEKDVQKTFLALQNKTSSNNEKQLLAKHKQSFVIQDTPKRKQRVKRLPRCERNKTIPVQRAKYPKQTSLQEQVVVDVLFVEPNYKTTSPEEIYGRATEVLIHEGDNSSLHATTLAEALEVPCLPYRKRHTGRYQFEHFGEHALRNYDGNPHGKGQNYLE